MNGNLVAIGLDLGTGGARAMAMTMEGELVGDGRCAFPPETTQTDGPCVEQSPQRWTEAAENALRDVTSQLPSTVRVAGISVDATSGTFLLADANRRPITSGIMYNDQRAVEDTARVAEAMRDDLAPYGISIASSFALSKIAFLVRTQPKLVQQARYVLHQTDWIIGMLCGRFDVTDISTALKTGADPGRLCWPAAMGRIGIPEECLPEIVLPGTAIGEITPTAAEATGLSAGTPVIAGCTDGTAGCLASGARQTGDLNVTLGTTLVFKAIAEQPLVDPTGVLYNHRHPAGGYLPGAASSTGGDWISQCFPHADLESLGQRAREILPSGRIAYPLVKTGERFPFACAHATGFGMDGNDDSPAAFAAGLEGVAFLERLGIERLNELGLPIGPTVFATGGAVAGPTWLAIRAAVNRRTYQVPQYPDCAVGAAVLAAVPSLGSPAEAGRRLVRPGHCVEPDGRLGDAYDRQYEAFVTTLRERGYL